MRLDPHKEKREACQYILAYLLDNPDAGDTFDGIVEWWLLHQRIRFETRTVSEAVAKLVADGLILEQQGPDSRIVYRANQTGANIQATLSQLRNSLDD
jgi:hypothetical protein